MRLIDADELNFEKLQDINNEEIPIKEYLAFLKGVIAVEELIKNAPTIDAEPVVHAHWINKMIVLGDVDEYSHTCSNCGFVIKNQQEICGYNGCPSCLSKMDEEVIND